ncbi:hypothetical protein F2Q68_00026463 [Brassica cretica]|uniref:fructose-bisphosphate aldolase n=1 Tax=Brassica cretica TaxID=69181 RepID=A0A8S9IAQ2_BRACR|nr:hypothetical protein F2Q68_00026463 [Brassica cretica]
MNTSHYGQQSKHRERKIKRLQQRSETDGRGRGADLSQSWGGGVTSSQNREEPSRLLSCDLHVSRTVPPAVPAIVFLSGGQSEEEATKNLNAMNQLKTKKPWSLSFSFGRALQQSTLKTWAGKEENVKAAQEALYVRCKANSEATLGTYKGDAKLGDGAAESLHVKDYKY